MEIKKTRRQYDQTTKDAAVKAILIDGEKAVDVAERYGITTGLLYKWIAVYKEKQAEFIEYTEAVEAELSSDNDEDLPEFEVIFPASELVEEIPVPEETEKKFDCSILKPRPEPVFRPVGEVLNTEDIKNTKLDMRCENNERIKAAAYDEIADITDRYAGAGDKEMLFYINGVIGLTERLCGGGNNG